MLRAISVGEPPTPRRETVGEGDPGAAASTGVGAPTGRRGLVLVVTSATAFMVFLDSTIVNISFPSIERSFPDTTRAGLSWILNAYSVVFAALLVPAGRLGDMRGRRRWFINGLAIFALASAACAIAPSAEFLIAARVLQAIGAAVTIPTGLAFVLAEYPQSQRSLAVALYAAGAAVATSIGPPLGGVIVEWADWRWIFVINLPIALATGLVAHRVLNESRSSETATPDWLGIVLVTAGVGLLALGIVQGEEWGWTGGRVLLAFGAAAVLLPLFVLRSAHHPAPVVELRLFRIRTFAVANVAVLLLAVCFYAMILAQVLFLTSVWGYSALEAGLAMMPSPLIAAVVGGVAGSIADRRGHRLTSVAGTLVTAGAGLWYAQQLGARPAFVAEWLPGNVLLGIGLGLGYATLISASVVHLPHDRFAVGSGINTGGRQVGAVLGVALVVAVVGTPAPAEALSAFQDAWVFVIALALAAMLVALLLPGPRKAPEGRM
jgi:EmrB/QacA subfamily drug resistance transporter